MTISKKLSIAIVLALGIQLSAGAFYGDIQQENASILQFAQDLRNQNSTQAEQVAQWLDEQVINGSQHHQTIIAVLENYNLTEQSKLTLLSEIIAQQKSNDKKQAREKFVNDALAAVFCVGGCALFAWAIIEDIKNPRRVVYRQPSVTVTTTKRYLPQTTWFQTETGRVQSNWYYI